MSRASSPLPSPWLLVWGGLASLLGVLILRTLLHVDLGSSAHEGPVLLVLGDSLTPKNVPPYAEQLQDLLQDRYEHAKVINKALFNQSVLCRPDQSAWSKEPRCLVEHAPQVLQKLVIEGTMLDHALVLGGLNDIARGAAADVVFDALLRIMASCMRQDIAKVVCMTIPRTPAFHHSNAHHIDKERRALNRLLRTAFGRWGPAGKGGEHGGDPAAAVAAVATGGGRRDLLHGGGMPKSNAPTASGLTQVGSLMAQGKYTVLLYDLAARFRKHNDTMVPLEEGGASEEDSWGGESVFQLSAQGSASFAVDLNEFLKRHGI